MAIREIALVRANYNVFRSSSGMLEGCHKTKGSKYRKSYKPLEANISDDKRKYYQFPGYTLYLLPKYRQIASGILTGVKEGLTSHYDLIKRDFNAHSTRWGYKGTNIAGKEIEDMLNSNPLELIYSNEDPATHLHYNVTRTTPDLLRVSSDISEHTRRKIIEDPGSGYKPVIASINIGRKA
ncbi:unnamed protein product [Rodentolepis nana]|uniref:Endo/exonuclease/phosphatase domain-containing protein n=1 Tax=Rodentolepis nana TaxID=102285 RepID=A0A0R3TUZ9_RODNA|nr:unnamed protein product [Rodentolepis nana]